MPIEVMVCYSVVCDTCGEDFEGDYIPHFISLADARQGVCDSDGEVWEDHVWCENCIPLCTCGHTLLDHDRGDAPCEACACGGFAPVEELAAMGAPAEAGKGEEAGMGSPSSRSKDG